MRLLRPISDLRELYQQVILDHNKRPRNFRTIDAANTFHQGAQSALLRSAHAVRQDGGPLYCRCRVRGSGCDCPAAQWLPAQVEEKARGVEGVTDARVDVVFDPPWSKDNMSEAAKLQLGLW